MAQECGFFNAQLVGDEYDRVYLAEQFAAYFASFVGNGVFGKSMQKLEVMAQTSPSMSIKVLPGEAWINGWWYRNTEDFTLSLNVADGVLNRIDVIVLRWGNQERDIWLQVISGIPSTNPAKPNIRRDADYYDLQLATINVSAGTIKITQSLIQDTRLDNSVCGLVTGVVDQIDTTDLYNQFEAYFEEFKSFYEANYDQWTQEQQLEFKEWYETSTTQWTEEFLYWFENVKDKLTDDAAGHLQSQIDKQYVQLTTYTDKAISDLIGGAPETLDTLKEIADAMAQNESVVEALDQAIGTKASQAELDTHTGNGTIHITASERTKWNGAVTKAQQNAAAVEQLNTDVAGKQEEITGAASSIASSNLTASRALVSNSAGKVAVSAVTSTELGCLAGVTSNVQSQLNGKQAKLTNPLTQSDVVNNLTSTETKKPLSANQGKILNDKISQKSRLYVQLVTITGNGSDWAIVSNAGKYLITAQTVREDTSFYVKGINKQNAAGVYTLIFSGNIPQSSKQAVWITWID